MYGLIRVVPTTYESAGQRPQEETSRGDGAGGDVAIVALVERGFGIRRSASKHLSVEKSEIQEFDCCWLALSVETAIDQ
jgi:hypothetical protein